MFDENKFIYDILKVDTNNKNGYVRIADLLNSLGFEVDYKNSKKHGIVEGSGFKCKNQKGAITLNGKKNKVIVNLVIKGNAFHGILSSKQGTVVLRTNGEEINAEYYNKDTTKIAKKLKQVGKYGIENNYGINPDGEARITTVAELTELVETLDPKSKTLAKTKK